MNLSRANRWKQGESTSRLRVQTLMKEVLPYFIRCLYFPVRSWYAVFTLRNRAAATSGLCTEGKASANLRLTPSSNYKCLVLGYVDAARID